MNNQNREASNERRPKYKYLDKSLNQSLNKAYCSPQRKDRSLAYGRRSTIQDFSPYRNIDHQHCRVKKNIIQQITMQNQLLNHQLIQYRAIVSRLEEQILSRDHRIISLEAQLTKNNSMYENIILEIKEQIKLVLSKNLILQGELSKIAQLRTRQKFLTESLKENEFNLRDQLSDLIAFFELKSTKSGQSSSQKKMLLKSPIQIRNYLESLLKRNATLQEFLKSVLQMHFKIENQALQPQQLKSLWKWLKGLGQEHNYFRRLKKSLTSRLGLNPDQTIQDIIDKVLLQQLKIVV